MISFGTLKPTVTMRLHELIGLRCLRNGVCVACVPLRVCPSKHCWRPIVGDTLFCVNLT